MEELKTEFLKEDDVLFLDETTKEGVISLLVDRMVDRFGDKVSEIKSSITKREAVISTGIGKEVAIPHARCSFIDDFTFILGICKGPGLIWDSIDNDPVKIVCLVVGPDQSPREYLKFLSSITAILHDDELKKKILKENDKKNIVNIFSYC